MTRLLSLTRQLAVAAVLLACLVMPVTAAELPKTLKIAGIMPNTAENAWTASLIQAMERVKAKKPHGVEIQFDYTESVWGDKGVTVFETYADAGYDILFGHSSFTDEAEALRDRYPDTMFVTVGSGNRPIGGNVYLVYMHLHEPAYLLGIIGGMMTKSNVLGAVGLFPADDVNDQVNAFIAGARSVNPATKVKVTFIESWYDPAKAQEAANAQIAAGADYIFQLGESFETCKAKKVYCFGNYVDGHKIAGKVVPTSTLVYWDPVLNYLVDEWKNHKTTNEPYDAPENKIWFPMSKGGGDLAPYYEFETVMPAEVKTKVAETKEALLSGKMTIDLDMSLPKSD